MRKFVMEIAKQCVSDDAFVQNFRQFLDMRSDPSWQAFVRLLHTVQGLMATELLSDRFAKEDALEKDIKQRTYANIRHFLEFLENPSLELQRAMFLWGNQPQAQIQKRRQKGKFAPAEKG